MKRFFLNTGFVIALAMISSGCSTVEIKVVK